MSGGVPPAAATASFTVPADHPSLPGHFLGEPIVPGVVLLDAVLALAVPTGRTIVELPSVKFLRVVHPGEPITVTFEPEGVDRVGIRASVAGETALRGTVRLAPGTRP